MCDKRKCQKNFKGDEDMTVKELQEKLKAKNHTKKIPHLKIKNGSVEIDAKKPEQVKWFNEFKK